MFLAQIKQAKAKKKKKKQRKLHLSAAQQLVASQEADGHFDAFKLSFKMARVWEKLGIPSTSMPSGINTKNENDLIFGITHSGGTFELLELAPLVKERGGIFCSMVGIEDSPLTKLSDEHILAPITNEILDKIPSRSIISQEVLINALASNIVELKGFVKSDFLYNHPGGSIGKQK